MSHSVEAAHTSQRGLRTSEGQHPEHLGKLTVHIQVLEQCGDPESDQLMDRLCGPPVSARPARFGWEVLSSFGFPVSLPSPPTTLHGGGGPQRWRRLNVIAASGCLRLDVDVLCLGRHAPAVLVQCL